MTAQNPNQYRESVIDPTEGNPHTIRFKHTTDRDGDVSGYALIQPPVELHDDFLDLLSGDVNVAVRNRVSTKDGTLLRITTDNETSFGMDYSDRIRHTLNQLHEYLGAASCTELFFITNL